jgi:SAM-dependent methyltransferase
MGMVPLSYDLRVYELCGAYMSPGKNLNVGCGRQPLTGGWINLDRVGGYGADIVAELGREAIPLPDDSMSCVYASQVLEHIPDIISAMREIHRVLEPGGVLVACTPYASSDGAVEDPTHVRYFTERSWMYFDKQLYLTPGQCGYYPSPVDYTFEVLKVELVPKAEYVTAINEGRMTKDELQQRLLVERNVIHEMYAYLRAVKEPS